MQRQKPLAKDQYYLDGIAKSDSVIISQFYEAFFGSVADYILRNNGTIEDAKDVFQDAVIVLFQKIKRNELVLYVNLNTYLYSVCKNVWLKRLRKTNKEANSDLEDLPPLQDNSLEENMEQQSKYKLFRSKFSLLGEACQKVLSHFFAKKKLKEIAKLLGLSSEAYAKKKKYKCQKELIQLIKADQRFKELID